MPGVARVIGSPWMKATGRSSTVMSCPVSEPSSPGGQLDGGVHEIEPLGEALQRHEVARRARADELEGQGRGPAPQRLAPGPQRMQDDVAQLVVLGHELAQVGARHPQDAAGLGHARRQERALAVEQTELSDERARTHVREHRLVDPPQRVADHLDLARVHEDQIVVAIARPEDVVPLGDVLGRAEARAAATTARPSGSAAGRDRARWMPSLQASQRGWWRGRPATIPGRSATARG